MDTLCYLNTLYKNNLLNEILLLFGSYCERILQPLPDLWMSPFFAYPFNFSSLFIENRGNFFLNKKQLKLFVSFTLCCLLFSQKFYHCSETFPSHQRNHLLTHTNQKLFSFHSFCITKATESWRENQEDE